RRRGAGRDLYRVLAPRVAAAQNPAAHAQLAELHLPRGTLNLMARECGPAQGLMAYLLARRPVAGVRLLLLCPNSHTRGNFRQNWCGAQLALASWVTAARSIAFWGQGG